MMGKNFRNPNGFLMLKEEKKVIDPEIVSELLKFS